MKILSDSDMQFVKEWLEKHDCNVEFSININPKIPFNNLLVITFYSNNSSFRTGRSFNIDTISSLLIEPGAFLANIFDNVAKELEIRENIEKADQGMKAKECYELGKFLQHGIEVGLKDPT